MVMTMVKLAMEEMHEEDILEGCPVKIIVDAAMNYGARFKVTEGEVMEFLVVPLSELFKLEM